ncbi:MAG: hydrogenase iron-sulfur subunit, partial [Alphaproteobacteria bacterium]
PNLCTSCGICVGACPTSTPFRRAEELSTGIDLPDFSLADLRSATERAAGRLGTSGPRVLVFGCDHGAALDGLAQGAVRLPCVGMLPPPFIDYALARGLADGIVLAGCAEGSCHFRHGIRWTEDRIASRRDPYLRARVPRERIATVWAGPSGRRLLARELDRFRARLEPLAPAPSDESALRVGREGQAASDD